MHANIKNLLKPSRAKEFVESQPGSGSGQFRGVDDQLARVAARGASAVDAPILPASAFAVKQAPCEHF